MKAFASLRGKVALVTGAAGGIGGACARELAADLLEQLRGELSATGCGDSSPFTPVSSMLNTRHPVASCRMR